MSVTIRIQGVNEDTSLTKEWAPAYGMCLEDIIDKFIEFNPNVKKVIVSIERQGRAFPPSAFFVKT